MQIKNLYYRGGNITNGIIRHELTLTRCIIMIIVVKDMSWFASGDVELESQKLGMYSALDGSDSIATLNEQRRSLDFISMGDTRRPGRGSQK